MKKCISLENAPNGGKDQLNSSYKSLEYEALL